MKDQGLCENSLIIVILGFGCSAISQSIIWKILENIKKLSYQYMVLKQSLWIASPNPSWWKHRKQEKQFTTYANRPGSINLMFFAN